MTLHLPTLNAILNGTTVVLLTGGLMAILKGQKALHKKFMIGALLFSLLFLTTYLIYHYQFGSTRFTGQGWIRPLYFFILITHTILAAGIVPMVLLTLYKALKEDFVTHKKIARWTWPIWIYVSLTGVIIYLFLYGPGAGS